MRVGFGVGGRGWGQKREREITVTMATELSNTGTPAQPAVKLVLYLFLSCFQPVLSKYSITRVNPELFVRWTDYRNGFSDFSCITILAFSFISNFKTDHSHGRIWTIFNLPVNCSLAYPVFDSLDVRLIRTAFVWELLYIFLCSLNVCGLWNYFYY